MCFFIVQIASSAHQVRLHALQLIDVDGFARLLQLVSARLCVNLKKDAATGWEQRLTQRFEKL